MKYSKIELVESHFNNGYISITSAIHLFPIESIGGPNKTNKAEKLLEIHYGSDGSPIRTDIAGDKNILRDRSWFNKFIQSHGLEVGDSIVIEKVDDFVFHIYPSR